MDAQGFDKRGFVWYTNFESRKSQEMSHNPYGALSFWWSEVQRAVRIEGVVCKVYVINKSGGEEKRASKALLSMILIERRFRVVQSTFASIERILFSTRLFLLSVVDSYLRHRCFVVVFCSVFQHGFLLDLPQWRESPLALVLSQ